MREIKFRFYDKVEVVGKVYSTNNFSNLSIKINK